MYIGKRELIAKLRVAERRLAKRVQLTKELGIYTC